METLELSQKEIEVLLEILESQDLSEVNQNITELVLLHDKISSLQTY